MGWSAINFSAVGLILGATVWFLFRYGLRGLFTVNQNERAVKTSFGRAPRLAGTTLETPLADTLRPEERARYGYPQVEIIGPGGPYFCWPWQKVYKVSVAVETLDMA